MNRFLVEYRKPLLGQQDMPYTDIIDADHIESDGTFLTFVKDEKVVAMFSYMSLVRVAACD